MKQVVRIVVPLYLPKPLDYLWAGHEPPQPYQLVSAPVGNKYVHGMVSAPPTNLEQQTSKKGKPFKLKEATPLDILPLPEPTGAFYQWVSRYNFAYPGEGLRAALLAGKVPEKPEPRSEIICGALPESFKPTPAQKKVLGAFQTQQAFENQASLARKAEVSTGVVKGLLEKGLLEEQMAASQFYGAHGGSQTTGVKLGEAQKNASNTLKAAISHGGYQAFLLDGVTGSGKTEVYFDVISHFLQEHKTGQILVMLPEIALTPQWTERFKKRFGFEPHAWHSSVTEKQRRETWWAALEGEARVIVGARSALFLPFCDLRLVVVDEEHDASYKQEEGFRYNGRDMAIVRAKLFKCPVVLATATPSLETWHNAQQGRYQTLTLPNRYGDARMPEIHLIDLTKHKPPKADKFIAPILAEKMAETLEEGRQVMLFLNRRGYAPLLICRSCGHRIVCPSCSANLVVHAGHLQCHHCGFEEPMPETCPKCHKEQTLHPFGPGTRKVLAEVKQMFPQARCAVVDRDSVQTTAEMQRIVNQMENYEIDILVGTQMLAKGHDFSHLKLVGVLDGDMGLAYGDLRAMERTFQLLTQVAGRAGRRAEQGAVYIQTHSPEHPLFQAVKAMDRDGFLGLELKSRQMTAYPPFGRLTGLIVSSASERDALEAGQKLSMSFPGKGTETLYGPAPAPLHKLRDRYRYRLLLKTSQAPQKLLQDWLLGTPLPKNVRLDVDIDPQSFF